MSKSKNNYIGVMETKEEIWKKLSIAKTDENRKRRNDPGNPDICNIFTLHRYFNDSEETLNWVVDGCKNAKIGCFDCKKRLLENIDAELAPIRNKRNEFVKNPELVYNIINKGAEICKKQAEETMKEVRHAIGIL